MKKTIFGVLACLFFLTAPALKAAESSESRVDAPASGWYLGTALGVDAPLQAWDPAFSLAGGGNLLVGCHLSPSLALQFSLNPWFFTGGGLSIVDSRISAELKVLNPSPGWAPYVLIGPAYDFQVDSPSGYTTSSLAGLLGIGFQFDLHPGSHAFIEGRYDFLLYNNFTQQDVPVLVGLTDDL